MVLILVSMKKWRFQKNTAQLLLASLYAIYAANALAADSGDVSKRESVKIWKTLIALDIKKSKTPPEVEKLLGKDQKVAGFMIPNDTGGMDDVREFLLTPVAGGCSHVPPPPPNYIINVKMKPGSKTKILWGVIEVAGKLKLAGKKNKEMFGYELEANEVKELGGF